jgi:NAD(P)-dependent dehydrogenase (short-subunit alcohol dehydrogenase family)
MKNEPLSMTGKRVLVTGAGTGIGREIALEFARNGAHVTLHYGQSAEGAASAVREGRNLGVRMEVIQADLSNLDEGMQLVRSAEAAIGPIDILINNAGITFNAPFLQLGAHQFQKLYDVNVRAGFFLTQRVVPGMIERGWGAICNLTSVHGLQGAGEHSAYAGTKGAIIAHTRALGVELAPHGVRVNAIAPGWIDVENHARAVADYNPEVAREMAAQKVPVGRFGLPIDVARLAVFLCSDAASFIVGQTFVVDGGTTALMSLFADSKVQSATRFGERYMSAMQPPSA